MGHLAQGEHVTVEVVTEFMGGGSLATKIALFGTLTDDVRACLFPFPPPTRGRAARRLTLLSTHVPPYPAPF